MKLGINNHTTVKGKRIVKICQVEIIKKIRKIWKKANIVGTTISFFFFFFLRFERNRGGKKWKKEFMANSKQTNSVDWISSKSF